MNLMTSRRKRRFIDTRQQLRFAIVIVFLSWFFPLLFLALAVSPTFSGLLFGSDAEAANPLIWNFVAFCFQHWWVVLMALVFIGFCSVFLSHMIFGPMRHFENVLERKKASPNEPVHCQLRRTDYFQGFSKLLEEVLNGLQSAEGSAPAENDKVDPAGSQPS